MDAIQQCTHESSHLVFNATLQTPVAQIVAALMLSHLVPVRSFLSIPSHARRHVLLHVRHPLLGSAFAGAGAGNYRNM